MVWIEATSIFIYYKRWSQHLAWADFTLQSPNPATFSLTNPIKRKKLVSPWVLLYWVSKRERSSAIKTTLLSLLLITSTQPQHIRNPFSCLVDSHLWQRHCGSNLHVLNKHKSWLIETCNKCISSVCSTSRYGIYPHPLFHPDLVQCLCHLCSSLAEQFDGYFRRVKGLPLEAMRGVEKNNISSGQVKIQLSEKYFCKLWEIYFRKIMGKILLRMVARAKVCSYERVCVWWVGSNFSWRVWLVISSNTTRI